MPAQHPTYATFTDFGVLRACAQRMSEPSEGAALDASIDAPAYAAVLARFAKALCPDSTLLRHYVFDAAKRRNPTDRQAELNRARGFEVRLGKLNVDGDQKGVDTMLAVEMAVMACTGMVQDIILIGSDYDLFPGFERAKAAGARVHLIDLEAIGGRPCQELSACADAVEPLTAEQFASFIKLDDREESGEARRAQIGEADLLAARFASDLERGELAAAGLGKDSMDARRLDYRLRKALTLHFGSEPTSAQLEAARDRVRRESAASISQGAAHAA